MQTINIYRSSTLGLETLTFILKTKLYAELAALESLPKKMKFSIKDFFSKCDQIRRKLRICSHLLNKSLMKNFIFCAVCIKVFSLKKTSTFFLEIESLQQNQSLKFIFWKECPVSFNSCIAIFQLKYLKLSFCKFHAQMNISV